MGVNMDNKFISILVKGRTALSNTPRMMQLFVAVNELFCDYKVILDELTLSYENRSYRLADIDLVDWMNNYLSTDDLTMIQFKMWNSSDAIQSTDKRSLCIKLFERAEDENRRPELVKILKELRPFRKDEIS